MKNLDCNQIKIFIHLEVKGEKDKKKKNIYIYIYMWGSKTWAHGVGSGTTFHQQYVRGEETIENLCN